MGTLHHQGDLHEATAYALPFLCALAADPPFTSEPRLLCGLITIAGCTTYEKNAAVAPASSDARAARPHVPCGLEERGHRTRHGMARVAPSGRWSDGSCSDGSGVASAIARGVCGVGRSGPRHRT